MKKRVYKILFFLLLMMPACVNASDYLLCGDNKKIPLILGTIFSTIFTLIRILVPLLLVITGMLSFLKAILASKVDDELQKAKKSFIGKVLAAVVIFFIVSIANFAVALVAGKNNSFSDCLYCVIHPDSCEHGAVSDAKLCPGFLAQQTDYDDNCLYVGSRKAQINHSNTGDTGVPDYTNRYGNTNSSSNTNSSTNDVSAGDVVIETIDGVTYVNGILIANKTYGLPSSYNPGGLTSETLNAYEKMKKAASGDGIVLSIVSGFRTYSEQKNLYNRYVERDGKDKTDTYSARPGHSEHQTGLAFDVNNAGSSFDNTPEAKWINDNCYKYGFIVRYPNGKTDKTGFKYESWHLRYVGNDLAEKLYNNGSWISLEEYFNLTSVYSD